MLVEQHGAHKGQLARGEHKSIQTDRVILVPGAPMEIETVRWMYKAFVEEGSLMQRESASLDREFRLIEETYGADHLDVVLAQGLSLPNTPSALA
jgi:hypothetical protein